MSYYSGTATSLANLLANFLTNAQADGWTLTGSVLSKAGVYFQLTSDADNIKCLGCESNAVANPAPGVVSIGVIYRRSGFADRAIAFPCNYEVFGFSQEIYLVVNYSVDKYQWMAMGKSTVPGLPGQGGWCGASIGVLAANSEDQGPIFITPTQGGRGGYGFGAAGGGLFYQCGNDCANAAISRNAWVNHGLDDYGWNYDSAGSASLPIGILALTPLHTLQPSVWNSEAMLLPIRSYSRRPSFKSSLIADLQFARHLRIDNLAPGDILTIGSDKWKIFPWHAKNAAQRNGSQDASNQSLDHSGTFGWAIKYEGP